MTFEVVIHEAAHEDIRQVLAYFHQVDAVTMMDWFVRLHERIQTLDEFPRRFPLIEEGEDLGLALRVCPFGSGRGAWKILYEVRDTEVHVVRIRRANRDRLKPGDLA